MAVKIITLFFAAVLVTQASSRNVQLTQERSGFEEIRLADRTVNHMTNPLIGFGISIPHLILDTLEACTVTFPNSITYEVFPNSNLPNTVIESTSVFPACTIGFRGPSVSMSGTYELTALTTHWDGRRTLQHQRFNVIIRESEPW